MTFAQPKEQSSRVIERSGLYISVRTTQHKGNGMVNEDDMNIGRFCKFGLSLLQLMLILGTIGLVATAIYEYLH